MLRKMGFGVACGTLVAAVLALGGEVFAEDVRALKVERREAKLLGEEVVFHLVNQSEKTITAWYFGCLTVSPLGAGSLTAVAVETYYEYAIPGTAVADDSSGPIQPGQKRTQAVKVLQGEQADPLAAKTCAPILVVFEDTSFEGDADRAEAVFRQRAEDAKDVALAREELLAEVGNGTPLVEAVGKLVGARKNIAQDARQSTLAASQLERFAARASAAGKGGDTAEILAELEAYYEAAMRHLPGEWQAVVNRELK